MLTEAAANVPFMALAELKMRAEAGTDDLIILDVRERDAYEGGHIGGAILSPRGQLELRVNQDLRAASANGSTVLTELAEAHARRATRAALHWRVWSLP